jgi:hypothetical protein
MKRAILVLIVALASVYAQQCAFALPPITRAVPRTDPPKPVPPAPVPTPAEILALRAKIAELVSQEAAMVAALNAELAKLGPSVQKVEASSIGKPGKDGHSPVLTWVGDQIAIDGKVTGPHLTGPIGPPGPQGPAGPPAPTPPILDPLGQALTAAWSFESSADKTKVQDLASYYAAAALKPGGIIYDSGNTTPEQIHEVFKAARDKAMMGALPNTIEAIRKWMNTTLSPDPANKPLDDTTRDKIAAAFNKVSKSLTELK